MKLFLDPYNYYAKISHVTFKFNQKIMLVQGFLYKCYVLTIIIIRMIIVIPEKSINF